MLSSSIPSKQQFLVQQHREKTVSYPFPIKLSTSPKKESEALKRGGGSPQFQRRLDDWYLQLATELSHSSPSFMSICSVLFSFLNLRHHRSRIEDELKLANSKEDNNNNDNNNKLVEDSSILLSEELWLDQLRVTLTAMLLELHRDLPADEFWNRPGTFALGPFIFSYLYYCSCSEIMGPILYNLYNAGAEKGEKEGKSLVVAIEGLMNALGSHTSVNRERERFQSLYHRIWRKRQRESLIGGKSFVDPAAQDKDAEGDNPPLPRDAYEALESLLSRKNSFVAGESSTSQSWAKSPEELDQLVRGGGTPSSPSSSHNRSSSTSSTKENTQNDTSSTSDFESSAFDPSALLPFSEIFQKFRNWFVVGVPIFALSLMIVFGRLWRR